MLDALGERGLNVQFVVQVIDHEQHDQMVLCVDRGDLPGAAGGSGSPAARDAARRSEPRAEVASIAIFGPDFRERPGIAGRMFRTLAARGINILAISTSISTVNCIIALSDLKEAYAAICDQFDVP